jgi:hypothetical protein
MQTRAARPFAPVLGRQAPTRRSGFCATCSARAQRAAELLRLLGAVGEPVPSMDAVARAKLAPTGLAEENLLSLLSTLNARVVDGLRLGLSAKAAAMEQQARHRPVALRSAPLRAHARPRTPALASRTRAGLCAQ